jgi:DNA mismatch repair protein MutH
MVRLPPPPPDCTDTLLERARALAGYDLATIAGRFGTPVPRDLRRNKGWIGTLVETALGATASSKPLPDFPHLGVELKTIPVTSDGQPRESTYVCVAPIDGSMARTWEASWVRKKLSTVLWVPVLGEGAPGTRRLGTPWLWSPSADELAVLERDWTELAEIIALGEHWQLNSRHGEALQIRPKAANSRDRVWTLGDEGEWVRDVPRGWYLRPSFTRALIQRALRV